MRLNTLSKDAICIFYRQIATMLTCDIPLQEALLTLTDDNENPGIKKMLTAINRDLEKGINLMDSLSNYPLVFNDILIQALKQEQRGEVTGQFLFTLADEVEKNQQLRIKLLSAITLPMITMGVAFFVMTIILVFCIPVFAEMFQGMGAALPAPTLFVMSLSDFIIENSLYITVPMILLLIFLKRNKSFRYKLFSWIPGIGNITKKISILMFTRHLGMMLSLEVPIGNALHYSAMNNPLYSRMILQLSDAVSHTDQLENALASLSIFPKMLVQMVRVGSKTNALGNTLTHLTNYYEKEVDRKLSRLLVFADFFLILLVGLCVGGLVISMYLPIFKMGTLG